MSMCLMITSGNGPLECCQAVAGVLDRLLEEAVSLGIDADVSPTPAKHGLRSAIVLLHGADASSFAARWTGTICWRAQSTLRPHHKRANWFIGVFAMDQRKVVQLIAAQDVRYETFRAGGPGGQHQNTTDSAVRATHLPTGLTAVAREMRSQHRNKALAFERLQTLANAQEAANRNAAKSDQNALHTQLERGNPLRSFKGAAFREEIPR